MRRLCLLPIMLTATVLVGCAGLFNSDIYKADRRGDLVVPACNTKPDPQRPEPSIPTPKRRVTPGLSTLRLDDFTLPNLTQLDSHLTQVAASDVELAAGLKVLEAVQSDSTMRDEFKRLFGVDLVIFSSHVPLIDEHSAGYADDALNKLDGEKLSDGSDLSGNTFVKEDHDKLVTAVSKATTSYGWTARFAKSVGQFARSAQEYKDLKSHLAPESSIAAARDHATAAVVDAGVKSTFAAYFEAYFRNGKIFDVQFDGNDLKQKIDDAIKNNATINGINIPSSLLNDVDTQIGNFYDNLTKNLCKSTPSPNNGTCTVLGGIGEKTFVTRAGKSLAFSGITLTLDPEGKKAVSTTKPNYLAVGDDLLRVLIEASWDSTHPVPGVDNSTLCAELKQCATNDDEKNGVTHANSAGDTTEAATAQVVGIVIRGGWLFSLNNEAAAESLTTGISVVFRKIAERVAYAQDTAPCNSVGTRGATVTAHGRAP